jgi:hypothetical protein
MRSSNAAGKARHRTSYLHLQKRNRRETARMLDPLAARQLFLFNALNGYRV